MEIIKGNKHLMDPSRPIRSQCIKIFHLSLVISQSEKSIKGSSHVFKKLRNQRKYRE